MNTARTPHSRYVLVVALVAMLPLTACSGADEDDVPGGAPEARTQSPSSSPSPASTTEDTSGSDGTPIRITLGDTQLAARLDDTASARDLAAQLPLTLTFRDHNEVEKTAPLPSELSLDDADETHDPIAGDIGYWAPDADLVLYYDDAPAFKGIVRVGEIDGNVEALKRENGDFEATIERAR